MMYKSPVYHIVAVPIEKIEPNTYNPNSVAPPELKLLYDSIKQDGYTMPVVCYGKRIDNPNTHGTGCTLSSAIAANLAKGFDLETSVQRSKDYISGALSAQLDLGSGSGPMNHAFDLCGEFAKEAE